MALQGIIRIGEKTQPVHTDSVELVLDGTTALAPAGAGGLDGTQVKETITMRDGILVTSSTIRTQDGTTTTTTTTTNTNDGSQTTTTTTTDPGGDSSTTVKINKK
jgi:hypothetical protein